VTQEEQEDAHLLKLVDGYFTSGANASSMHNSRHYRQPSRGSGGGNPLTAIHSPQGHTGVRRASSYPEDVRLDTRPQLIVAEEEKLFVEERDEHGEVVAVKERSLVDTVYALKDQLASLRKDVGSLTKTLEKEQKARRRLEEELGKRRAGEVPGIDDSIIEGLGENSPGPKGSSSGVA